MDRRRLADIRAGTPDHVSSGGTGYLVGQRLVLTCRHVVLDEHGQPWPRVQVRLGHPGQLRRLPQGSDVGDNPCVQHVAGITEDEVRRLANNAGM